MAKSPLNPKLHNVGLPILSGSPKAKDPVCGMSVDPAKAAGKVEHEGKAYYFCSPKCAERFTVDPKKFLVAPGTAGMEHAHTPAKQADMHHPTATAVPPVARAKDARYTCPMHPEVVQIGPGACPICGMALDPMDVFADVEAVPEYNSMRRRFLVSAAL